MVFFEWSTAVSLFKPFAYYSFGIAAYSIFVFFFYKLLSKKNIFNLNLRQYNDVEHPGLSRFFDIVLYLLEYLVILPLFTFFWFSVLTVLLVFLAKEHTAQSLLLVSIAVVSAVRITAYFSESLSEDLAKMLPFALLAVFLADTTYVSFSKSFDLVMAIPSEIGIILYYLLFTILLELVLRILYLMFGPESKAQRTR